MQSIKLQIKHNYNNEILLYQRQYSSLFHICCKFMYNDLKENKFMSLFDYKTTSSKLMLKIKQLNNINLLKNWLIQCCISESHQLITSFQYRLVEFNQKQVRKKFLLQKQYNKKITKLEAKELNKLNKLKMPKIIFGGKKLFLARCKNLISHDEYKIQSLNPIYSIGQKLYNGNRLFRISSDLTQIYFYPERNKKYILELVGISKLYKQILQNLYVCQQLKDIPITYKLTNNYISFIFDESILCNKNIITKIKDRYCALDLNPNYIGYSIIDWKSEHQFKIIEKGVYNLKLLNSLFNNLSLSNTHKKQLYKTNKRNYEIFEISKNLIKKCCYYHVENFIVENLNIKPENRNKGKNFNRLINNMWLRCKFLNNIKKRCNIFKINYHEVAPEYSSFTGNIIFRNLNLPDQILSSIEISRRGYEFRHQYILKDKNIIKNIVKIDINNKIFKDQFKKSLEEFSIFENFKDIIDAYFYFKRNSKLSYRVSLDNFSSYFRHFQSKQSLIFKC